MFHKICLVFFILIWPFLNAEVVSDYNNTQTYLITGGYEPKIQTHAKYIVSLADLLKFDPKDAKTFGEGHFCGGSIIGLKTILTAASCVANKNPKSFVVIAGTPYRTKRERATQVLYVAKILIHPQYEYAKGVPSANDIAILLLHGQIKEDHKSVQRVELATASFASAGTTCVLVGWGRLGHDGPQADALQYVELVLLEQEECDSFLKKKIKRTVCAAEKNRQFGAGCEGDTGGPLFCGYHLYGIDIFSMNCSKGKPTYFTEVSKYLDWIEENSLDKYIYYRSTAGKNLADNIIFNSTSLIIFLISSLLKLY